MQILLGMAREHHILNDPKKMYEHLKEYDISKIKRYGPHKSLFKAIQEWLYDFYLESEEVRKLGEWPHIDEIVSGCKDVTKEVAITLLYLLNHPEC